MSTPGVYNWGNQRRGDTIPAKTFKPITVDSVAVDLTNTDIRMQLRSAGGALVCTVIKGDGIELSGTDGFTVNLPKIRNYEGKAFYDIEFIFSDGTVKTWIEGEITIIKDTTY